MPFCFKFPVLGVSKRSCGFGGDRRKGGVRGTAGRGGQEVSSKDCSTAPPAVCLSVCVDWPVCVCVAGLQPLLFSDMFPSEWRPSFLTFFFCCPHFAVWVHVAKTKPCADLSPKDPAHSLRGFFFFFLQLQWSSTFIQNLLSYSIFWFLECRVTLSPSLSVLFLLCYCVNLGSLIFPLFRFTVNDPTDDFSLLNSFNCLLSHIVFNRTYRTLGLALCWM